MCIFGCTGGSVKQKLFPVKTTSTSLEACICDDNLPSILQGWFEFKLPGNVVYYVTFRRLSNKLFCRPRRYTMLMTDLGRVKFTSRTHMLNVICTRSTFEFTFDQNYEKVTIKHVSTLTTSTTHLHQTNNCSWAGQHHSLKRMPILDMIRLHLYQFSGTPTLETQDDANRIHVSKTMFI